MEFCGISAERAEELRERLITIGTAFRIRGSDETDDEIINLIHTERPRSV